MKSLRAECLPEIRSKMANDKDWIELSKENSDVRKEITFFCFFFALKLIS